MTPLWTGGRAAKPALPLHSSPNPAWSAKSHASWTARRLPCWSRNDNSSACLSWVPAGIGRTIAAVNSQGEHEAQTDRQQECSTVSMIAEAAAAARTGDFHEPDESALASIAVLYAEMAARVLDAATVAPPRR
jgi:hypothetical protein